MLDVGFDFTDRHVVVAGGTRGTGLAIARAFHEAGARVTVTGTKVLASLYDADLSAFSYRQLQLCNSEAIDDFGSSIGAVDVLVNAAGARLPSALEAHEREFIAHSARLGFIGPQRLTHVLRARLSESHTPSGGSVVHSDHVQRWYELSMSTGEAEAEFKAQILKSSAAWARMGIRVNGLVSAGRIDIPLQSSRERMRADLHREGSVLTRPATQPALAPVALFLASHGAAALTGQVLRAR